MHITSRNLSGHRYQSCPLLLIFLGLSPVPRIDPSGLELGRVTQGMGRVEYSGCKNNPRSIQLYRQAETIIISSQSQKLSVPRISSKSDHKALTRTASSTKSGENRAFFLIQDSVSFASFAVSYMISCPALSIALFRMFITAS